METGDVVDQLLAAGTLGPADSGHGILFPGNVAVPQVGGDGLTRCHGTQVLVAGWDDLLGRGGRRRGFRRDGGGRAMPRRRPNVRRGSEEGGAN